ncbi:MAG: hypothetical protein RIS76_2238 [Verrucomicrobiota bacterium]|jgi:hypothetical protein
MNLNSFRLQLVGLAAAILMGAASVSGADQPRTFTSPEDAVAALRDAVLSPSPGAILEIFGPEGSYLINADPVMAAAELARFSQGLIEGHQLVTVAADRRILDVGTNSWPFPVPIVQTNDRWSFDALAGREEILDRRIGGNELKVLETLRAFVAAQREYSGADQDGDDVLEFARKFISSPGKKDGLYWPLDLDGTESPIGPLVAAAQEQGYSKLGNAETGPQPFHGYYFKVLTRQGKHTPAGAYNYLINGHMIGGFAAVAWPAEFGETGVMTFLVNHQGRVYQKNLGPKTGKIAAKIKEYDPGEGWTVSPD